MELKGESGFNAAALKSIICGSTGAGRGRWSGLPAVVCEIHLCRAYVIESMEERNMSMGTLKYAILGMLNRKSMTGYDMAKEFDTTLAELWNAKHSQIYPELKNLVEAGLVQYDIEISGNVLEKKLYTITSKGKEEFNAWALTYHKLKPATKDAFRLQLFFADCISNEERIRLMQLRLEEHQSKLSRLKKKLCCFDSIPPIKENEFTDYLVLTGAILREESNCRWLEQCLEHCKKRG